MVGCSRPAGASQQIPDHPSSRVDATPSGTSGAFVEPSPIDRPSAQAGHAQVAVGGTDADDDYPVALAGRVWVARTSDSVAVGELGVATQLLLPADRQILGITPSVVVSASIDPSGATSTVYVTDRATADDQFAPSRVNGQLFDGRVAGTLVFATGFDATSSGDPGVVAISTVDGSVRSIVDPAPNATAIGPIGRNILVSPSEHTLVSSLCSPDGCSGGIVIDGDTGLVLSDLPTKLGPSALNDKFALIRSPGDVTTEIALLDILTGKEMWRDVSDRFGFAYVTGSGKTIIEVSRSGAYRIEVIEPNGERAASPPLAWREPTLWPELSTSDLAVVGSGGPFPGNVGGNGVVRASTIDLTNMQLEKDSVRIDISAKP